MKTIFMILILMAFVPQLGEAATIYSSVRGEDEPAEAIEYVPSDIEKVAQSVADAVVAVDAYENVPVYGFELKEGENKAEIVIKKVGESVERVSTGSAFFITSNGYLLTNDHVVSSLDAAYKIYDGMESIDAKVVYRDPEHDLAVLKVTGSEYPYIELSDSSDIEIGEEVVSVGNAFGKFVDSISSGEILSLDEKIVARDKGVIEVLDGLIATNARLYRGDSGGPLLNSRGQVVGVNVALLAGTDISFSIPVDVTRSMLEKAGVAF